MQQFRQYFLSKGIDIDKPEYGWLLDQVSHQRLHGEGYNAEWGQFILDDIETGSRATADDILKKLNQLESDPKYQKLLKDATHPEFAYTKKSTKGLAKTEAEMAALARNVASKLKPSGGKVFLKTATGVGKKVAIVMIPVTMPCLCKIVKPKIIVRDRLRYTWFWMFFLQWDYLRLRVLKMLVVLKGHIRAQAKFSMSFLEDSND